MKSWFAGTASSVNSEIITPFSNAEQIIYKYNQAIEHNSLTQQGWQRLIAQCDDGLASYLTNIKGSTASMSAYSVSLQGNITGYTKITQAMKQYNALGAVSQKEQQNFATAVSLTNTKLGSYLTGLNGAKASLSGYGVSLIASTAKTVGLTIATTALNAALTFGISAIITGVVSAFATWINSSKKITEAAEEAKDKISSINDDLKTNTETVENAKQRYAELAQEVENLGQVSQSRGSLSTDEYEEFLDLSNQLAGVFPQLTKGYDDNGNAILDLSGNVDTIVGSLDDLLQKEKDLANQKIMDEFPDVYKGYVKDLSDAESEVKSAKSEFDKINNAYQQLQNGSASQAFDLQGNGTFENADGEQVKVTLAEYEQALKDLGIEYEKTNIMVKNQFGGDTLSGYLINAVGDVDTAFTSKLETARKNLEYAEQQLEGEKSSIDSYLNTWLQSEFTYNQIDDSGLQTAVQDMIMNFDFSNLPDDIDKNDWNAVSEYLRRNILFAINDVQDDPEISKAISEVFTNQDLTPEEKANYLQQIKDYFDDLLGEDNAISISLQPQIDDTDALQKSIEKTADRFNDSDKIKDFFDTEGINTDEEVNDFNKVTEGINDADKAIQTWNEHKKEANETPISQSISDTIDQLNNQLKPAFDSLKSAYENIFTEKGFTLDNVDISMLDNIKSKLDELNENGVSIDYSSFETLATILTDTTSSADDVHNAFNNVATDIVSSLNPAIGTCSGENYKLIQSLLESVGIINSEQVMISSLGYSYEEYIAAKEEAKNAGLDLANATEDEINAFVNEAIESGNCGQALVLLQLKKLLVNSTQINTASDVQQIMNLASAAGMGAEVLTQLANAKSILSTVENGGTVSLSSYEKALSDVENAKQTMLDWKPVEIDFSPASNNKSAGSAGKEAADAYLEAFEKELAVLDDLRSRGIIDESTYLSKLKALYEKYFKGKKQYLDEYNKYERQYLEKSYDLYGSALSGITKLIGKQIDAYSEEKEVAVSSLEEERDARLAVIDAQKEQLQSQIDLIDKEIDKKQKEIDAINDAADARKRELDLQKAQYELERAMNQRTKLVKICQTL